MNIRLYRAIFYRKARYSPKHKLIFKNPQKTALLRLSFLKACLCLLVLLSPQFANAGFFNIFSDLFASGKVTVPSLDSSINSQNIQLLKANSSPDPEFGKGGGDITIVGGNSLLAEAGPLGTIGNIEDRPTTQQISVYVVRSGDTLSAIAKMFGVSVNTIVWANDISRAQALKEGQTLVILPVSGIAYTVKKGDTVTSIAKKYKADAEEIVQFNDLNTTVALAEGTVITIPEAEIGLPPATSAPIVKGKLPKNVGAHDTNGPNYEGYYTKPANGALTQGLHGYNGIDIGASSGSPIYASAAGNVIVARSAGWNGGYGKYVVIDHPNDTQTLYGHMSRVIVSPGDQVYRGQVIGYIGNTGRSTGPHLHFEVRGAWNPFQ